MILVVVIILINVSLLPFTYVAMKMWLIITNRPIMPGDKSHKIAEINITIII
jgi:hypothetical protein